MNITQLIKIGFDLLYTKNHYNYGKPYSFMRKMEGQYTWTSLHEKMDIALHHNYLNFSTPEKPLYQISDLFEDNQEADPHIKNVIICESDRDDLIIIHRYGNSIYYITDNDIPENAAAKGLLQEIDILNFTEEEYFQLSVLYSIPSMEEFKKLAKYHNDLQKLSTDNKLEITIVWSEMPDLDDISQFKEEDFDGYGFE